MKFCLEFILVVRVSEMYYILLQTRPKLIPSLGILSLFLTLLVSWECASFSSSPAIVPIPHEQQMFSLSLSSSHAIMASFLPGVSETSVDRPTFLPILMTSSLHYSGGHISRQLCTIDRSFFLAHLRICTGREHFLFMLQTRCRYEVCVKYECTPA